MKITNSSKKASIKKARLRFTVTKRNFGQETKH